MLSETTRIDLRSELDRLRSLRSRIDQKVQAIEAVLADDGADIARPISESPQPAAKGNGSTLAGRIRQVLAEIGRPTSSAEIVAILQRRGEKPRGKTGLNVLVSSELWRMQKKGAYGVQKVGHGRYVIATGGQ